MSDESIAELKQRIAFYQKQLENHRAQRDGSKKKKPMSAEVVDSNPYRFNFYSS
jgi:hypothetical protein